VKRRWSHAANDVVDVDYDEYHKPCAECGDPYAPCGGGHGGDEAFCEPCYDNIFGG